MTTPFPKRAAFTLVEMLVVIVIMSLLAIALVSALRSAQRQAHATLCQARMKNLHQACMNFLSDNNQYPYAGSHEYRHPVTHEFYEHKGWVAWIHKTDPKKDNSDPWAEDRKKQISHAKEFKHVGWSGPDATRAIKAGSIYKYCSGDTSTFFCKQFNGKDVRRSYAMNDWFGSRRVHLDNGGQGLHDFQNAGLDPSRMGYLIELASTTVKGDFDGEEADVDVGKRKAIPEDPAWEHKAGENFGVYHRKAGALHGHVIFVDGHLESLADPKQSATIGIGAHTN